MHLSLFAIGLPLLYIVYQAVTTVYQLLTSPLRDIPGPWLARVTKAWYFRKVFDGDFHLAGRKLHRKYGPIVRLGPRLYSMNFADKAAYGVGSKFAKSDWYEGWKHPSPDMWAVFPDRNIQRHAETRRKFTNLYSMTSLVSYEGYVDSCNELFVQKLGELAEAGTVINMTHWVQCYAYDVIGEINYSQRFGFLDRGEDIDGILAALASSMRYSTLVGVFPSLHPYLYPLMQKLPGSGAAGRQHLMKQVRDRIAARTEERRDLKKPATSSPSPLEDGMPQDFLDKVYDQHEANPDKVTPYHMFMMGVSNIIAGSDTTAISLSSVLYHLLKFPDTLQKLRDEIEEHIQQGTCDEPQVRFQQSQNMPYLQAVIKEALRLHPAVGLPLWREVPVGGAEVAGRYFPEGSVVGVDVWSAHFNEEVYGEDVGDFRPERWLDAEAAADAGHSEHLKRMEASYMPFGLGSRTCLGKHISILEMNKVVPRLVREFDFELEHPDREWTSADFWFVKPTDFRLHVKMRNTAGK